MKKAFMYIVLLCSGLLLSCSVTKEQEIADLGDTGTDPGTHTPGDSETSSTTIVPGPNDTSTEYDIDFDACAGADVSFELDPVAIMILQDVSGSMDASYRWGVVWPALVDMLELYAESNLRFGFDVFPDDSVCGVDYPVLMDCAQDETQAADVINSIPTGFVPNGGTPLYLGMRKFLDPLYAPDFFADGRPRYLLVVSDGEDTCGKQDGYWAELADFTVLTQQLRSIGINTLTIGFGDGVDEGELNAIATAGGTVFTEFIPADDEQSLKEAFAEIAGAIVECSFVVPEPQENDADVESINFFIGSDVVPYDDQCNRRMGWTWDGDPADRTARLCDFSCDRIRLGEGPIMVRWGCATVQVE